MQPNEVRQALSEFVRKEILPEGMTELDDHTPLLDSGIIESLSLVSLIGFIQTRFAVRVPDSDIVAQNFADLESISKLVVKLSAKSAAK